MHNYYYVDMAYTATTNYHTNNFCQGFDGINSSALPVEIN